MLAEVLLSIAYAADVGDPDGTVLLADDVSRRHDFGFNVRDVDQRTRRHGRCRGEVTPGIPWHVTGSLLGLDIGLAPLALRRINFERVLEAPKLTSNERDTFAVSVSLMNPFTLRDADRDAIADGVARGQRRVGALSTGGRPPREPPPRRRSTRSPRNCDRRVAAPRHALDGRARSGSRPVDVLAHRSAVPGGRPGPPSTPGACRW